VLISTIDTGLPCGIKLGVLDMEHLDERVIKIDILEIVELLQDKVAWIIQDIATRMFSGCFPETLESYTIVKVFTRVDLIAYIDTCLIEGIQDRQPSFCEFLEAVFYKPCRTLRP